MKKIPGEVWPIEKVKPWENNPRTISTKNFKRLLEQIKKHGVYKPLIVNQDGIIVGGNMRYQALMEMGIKEVWVSIVKTTSEAQMLEIALSDNDRAGEYDELKLAEMVTLNPVDTKLYHVDMAPPLPLEKLPSLSEADVNLPDGEKPGFQQITFVVSDQQAERIQEAMGLAKDSGNFEGSENKNSNGNAIAAVAEGYLKWVNKI